MNNQNIMRFTKPLFCHECNGRGTIICPRCGGDKRTEMDRINHVLCVRCNGYGNIVCSSCGGTGRY